MYSPQKHFFLLLAFFLIIAGLTACHHSENKYSNLQNSAAMSSKSSKNHKGLLYIVNKKKIKADSVRNIVSRIKPKYIQSIRVVTGKKAVYAFGKAASNGAIVMKVKNKKKAFHDLLPKGSTRTASADSIPSTTDTTNKTNRKQPVLIGGLRKLENKVKYPKKCWKAGVQGRVDVRFTVNRQGQVENPSVVNGIGHGCDKEAVRVVKKARFKPALKNGHPRRVQTMLPIVFTHPGNK